MRSRPSLLLTALAVLVTSPALATDIPWMSDIDTAVRLAQQTNRMVLVHFYTDSCPPCRKLENVVYSQPGVGQQIAANFVPVKINAEHNVKLARQLGVDRWPTDVILDASGNKLAKQSCPLNLTAYLGQLGQAARYLAPAPRVQVAAHPGGTAAGPYGPPTTPPNNAGRAPMPTPRAAGPYVPPTQQAKPPAFSGPGSDQTRPKLPPQAQPAPGGSPAYSPYKPPSAPPSAVSVAARPDVAAGQYQPPVGSGTPGQTSPGAGPSKPAPNPPVTTQQPGYKPYPYNPMPKQPTAQPPVTTRPPAYQPPATTKPPAYQPPAQQPVSRPQPNPPVKPQPGTPPVAPPYGGRPPIVSPPPANPAPPNNRQMPPPSQPSPFALDGMCPVELAEKEQWTQGDKRFGAVHRGKTYLFVGQEQQRKFLANPDFYAPAISGFDPVLAFDHGQQVSGHRRHGLTLGSGPNRRIYLFANEETLTRFCNDKARYQAAVRTAEAGQQPLRR